MTKHTPATPLPHVAEANHIVARDADGKLRDNWSPEEDQNHGDEGREHYSVAVFYGPGTEGNAAYYLHAANAYPKLVAALSLLVNPLAPRHAVSDAAALLRELGEE